MICVTSTILFCSVLGQMHAQAGMLRLCEQQFHLELTGQYLGFVPLSRYLLENLLIVHIHETCGYPQQGAEQNGQHSNVKKVQVQDGDLHQFCTCGFSPFCIAMSCQPSSGLVSYS